MQVVLRLIETFCEKMEDPATMAGLYVPAMMDPILGDYARALPDARRVGLERLRVKVEGRRGSSSRSAF